MYYFSFHYDPLSRNNDILLWKNDHLLLSVLTRLYLYEGTTYALFSDWKNKLQ